MDTQSFHYDLPDHAIAQSPAVPRDSSRLLVDADPPQHRATRDLPSLVRPGDVIVVNDTRVLAARLRLAKATGGAVECLVLEPTPGPDGDEGWWDALVKPSRRVAVGSQLEDHIGLPVLEVGGDLSLIHI